MLHKNMTVIHDVRRKYGRQAMVSAITIGLFFLVLGMRDVCRGLILGTIFSVFNFVLMSRSLLTRINKPKTKATISAMVNIMIRYATMGLPLFIAIKSDRFNILGTIVGLLTVQLMILANQLAEIIFSPKH